MKPHTGKIINCFGCFKEFYIPKNRFTTAKYCSRECKNKFGCTEKIKRVCEICKNEFEHISSRCNKAKYCSRKCYHKAQHKKGKTTYKCIHCEKVFQGSLSHNRKFCSKECVGKSQRQIWKPKFTTVRKKMLRENLIQKCEICAYDKFKEILGIHHIDGNRKNNERENLMVLCPNCHSIEHRKHISH